MTLCVNQGAAANAKMVIHLWIWMQQMRNADSLTTIIYISKKNVQHTIFVARKGISHVIIALKHRTIILQDLHSPSINRDHHYVTSIRPQADHQVLVAH